MQLSLRGSGEGRRSRVATRTRLVFFGVVAVALVAGFFLISSSPHSYQPWKAIRHVGDFSDERGRFDVAADLVWASGARSTHFADLTERYWGLSANGYAEVQGEAIFFPQWLAEGEGAGGFFRLADIPPVGYDMYGDTCGTPTDLGGGWWACGMDDPTAAAGARGWSGVEDDPPGWLWAVPVVIFGLWGLMEWQMGRAARLSRLILASWMTVPATITVSQVRSLGPLEGISALKRERWKGIYIGVGESNSGPGSAPADIQYEYALADQTYRSSRLTVVHDASGSFANEMVNQNPVGARVTVWVNPADVTEAVLDPEHTPVSGSQMWFMRVAMLVLGGVFLLAAMGVITGDSTSNIGP